MGAIGKYDDPWTDGINEGAIVDMMILGLIYKRGLFLVNLKKILKSNL